MKKVLLTLAMALLLPVALRAQLTEDFNNGIPSTWTTIDNDGDGYGWEGITLSQDGSNKGAASYSYINGTGALTPDNWLVTPAVTIGTVYTLSYKVASGDPNYPDEQYAVYVATSNTVDAFLATTAVHEETLSEGGVFKTVTIDLADYANQTVYIAFRHYNSSDQYCMVIDDVRVGGAQAPEVTVVGPAAVQVNTPVTFTANTDASTIAWYIGSELQSATSATFTHTFTALGDYQVIAKATNAIGDTYDTLDVNVYTCEGITIPYEPNFAGGLGCWDTLSYDTLYGVMWQPCSEAGIDGQVYSMSGYYGDSYTDLGTDSWLVSPEIAKPATGSYEIAYTPAAYANFARYGYYGEHYGVYIIQNGDSTLLYEETLTAADTVLDASAERYVYIPSTVTGSFKVAFRHFNSVNGYVLILDGIKLRTQTVAAPAVAVSGPEHARENAEVTFTGTIRNATSIVWKVDNAVVAGATGNTLAYTFTTTGDHTVEVVATNATGSDSASTTINIYSCEGISVDNYNPDFTFDGFGCWDTASYLTPDYGWFISNDGALASMSGELVNYMGMQFVRPVDVDNWVISPAMTMPANGNYQVSYFVQPAAPGAYAGDHYGVYLIQGSDSTLLFEESLDNVAEAEYRNVAIPATTGDFKIAFRHFNSENGYAIIIDGISFGPLEAPETVTVSGPESVENGQEATFTASCSAAQSFAWSVDGADVEGATSNTMTYTFTEDGNHNVTVTASNAAGNADATMTVNVYSCDGVSTFPYSESFENGLGCWSFVSNNEENVEYSGVMESNDDIDAEEGNKFFRFSSVRRSDDYNQFLITPELSLTEGTNYHMTFWYAGHREGYPESFAVLASTTGNNPEDFTIELAAVEEAPLDWTRMDVAIPAGTKYIAINYYSDYAYYLYVDDVTIEEGVGINDVDNVNMQLFPNPASRQVTISANGIEGRVNAAIVDLNGRTVMEQSANAQSFTFDLNGLARGAYFVRLTGENINAVRKLVVE